MAKVDKYAPIVASKHGGPVYLTVRGVKLFHKNTDKFWTAVDKMPNGFILSTRAQRGDKPQVHLHRVPCHIWRLGPDPTNGYVKGVSKSILALFQYAQRVYPNRLGPNVGGSGLDLCTCCTGALHDALAQSKH